MLPAAIDDVLHRLGLIIDDARRDGSRLGYFAALYRNVTAEVQRGIAAGRFGDGPRMARLDVVFANRYLDAYDAYAAGRPASRCWVAAFDAASRWPPLILQRLLLGMNVHIHLDLGIAAAEIARLDAMVAALAIPVAHPGLLARAALLGVRLREASDVRQVIDALDARRPAALAPA